MPYIETNPGKKVYQTYWRRPYLWLDIKTGEYFTSDDDGIYDIKMDEEYTYDELMEQMEIFEKDTEDWKECDFYENGESENITVYINEGVWGENYYWRDWFKKEQEKKKKKKKRKLVIVEKLNKN